jgi:two-component system, NtrC family, sensor kinase
MLSLAAAVLSGLLGIWIVGHPMKSLTEKARRTGQGDFSGPLFMRQNDELALLAREMNTMCERLVLAHERVDAETAARIAAIEQLRHADRLTTVGKLASGIAHELGTPLNVIAGRAGMIAEGETSPQETVSYARIVLDATEKMTRIIRSLLEFARRKGPQKAAQSLEPIVAHTLELLGPLCKKKGVVFALRAGQTKPVDVDRNQFEQVVTNLVVNAIQSMTHEGNVVVALTEEHICPPVDIGGEEADFACVRVEDEGVGIAPEHLPHVFEPFFTTKDVGEGTGLGLSVAYGIVRDHGGWIEVTSALGKGAEFAVYLPLHGTP